MVYGKVVWGGEDLLICIPVRNQMAGRISTGKCYRTSAKGNGVQMLGHLLRNIEKTLR